MNSSVWLFVAQSQCEHVYELSRTGREGFALAVVEVVPPRRYYYGEEGKGKRHQGVEQSEMWKGISTLARFTTSRDLHVNSKCI